MTNERNMAKDNMKELNDLSQQNLAKEPDLAAEKAIKSENPSGLFFQKAAQNQEILGEITGSVELETHKRR